MKILFASDIHLGVRKNSEVFMSIMENYFLNDVYKIIQENEIDQFWILGDLFDDRHSLDTRVKKLAYVIFDKLLSLGIQIKVLTGNHDVFYKNTLDTTTLLMFKDYHKNLEIIDKVKEYNLDGLSLIAYPWLIEESDEHKKFIELSDTYEDATIYDVCVGHFEVNGFEVVPGISHDGGISLEKMKPYKNVFSGHFHLRQKMKNLQYCGCPYELTWADYGDKKGVTIFDTSTQETTFIENISSPKHKKIYSSEYNGELDINKGDWIKVFIDSKIDDVKRIDMQSKIEAVGINDLTIVDEMEGTDIDNENLELTSEFEGNEIGFLNEYLDQIEKDEKNNKKLKEYSLNLYKRALEKK